MKHVKLIVALLLFAVLAVNLAFAAGPQTAGRLRLPQGQVEQPVKGTKAPVTTLQAPLEDGSASFTSFGKTVDQPVILSKSGTIPPGFQVSGLSGTYHIGVSNTFKTIADIALLCNIGALTGPVTFVLDDPSYTEAGVAIGVTSGSSATNTITIVPNTGNTACVITLTDNTTNDGGLVLDAVTYFNIDGTAQGEAPGSRNLTIQLSANPLAADGGDAPVLIKNSQNVSVANCVIPGNSPSVAVSNTTNYTTNGNASVKIRGTAGLYNSQITVDNCDLSGGHYGVQSRGNFVRGAGNYGVQDDNINVTNNYIHDTRRGGVELWNVTVANVANNIVKRIVIDAASGLPSEIGYVQPADGSADPAIPNPGSRSNLPHITRPGGIQVWGDLVTVDNNHVDSVINNRTSGGTGSGQTYGIRVVGFGANDPGATYGGGLSMGGVPTLSVVKNNIVTRVHANNLIQANGQLFSAIGIGMDNGRFDTVVFNTVYMSGTGGTASNACMVINGVSETSGNFGLPDWFGDGSTIVSAYSYRIRVRNNVFAMNRTGSGTSNALLGIQSSGGVMDYRGGNNNVLFMGSTGKVMIRADKSSYASLYDFQQYQIGGGQPADGASQADDPVFNSASDVNFSGLSTADGTGVNFGGITTDYSGALRSSPPDIGALEGTGTGLPHDVKPVALVSPSAAGAPAGLPFSPVQVTFLNLGGFTETSFPVNVNIVNPDASVQNMPGTVTLVAGAAATVTIPGSWNPGSTGGTAVFTITTSLGLDDYTFNDMVVANIPVAAQSTVPYTSGFETAPDQAGWFASTQWGLGTTGGKLGGPHAGTKYFVTNPGASANGTADATVHNLFSPFFDLSSTVSATLSFYLSIATEASWDRAIVEYSIDTGKTYQQLGVLNDPDGINWYSSSVYANAAGSNAAPDCWDNATAIAKGFPGDGSGAAPPAGWTSNGDCEADPPGGGPLGYVPVAIDLDGKPMLGQSYVRFRISYFTDAGTHGDGVAIDDFTIGAGLSSSFADYSGKIYNDVNGDGAYDGGDVNLSGVTVNLTYFGVTMQTTVTNGTGDYSFLGALGMYLAGSYNISTSYTGGAVSEDPADVNYTGNGVGVTGKNKGYFTGSISGMKFNDLNDNAANNSEPGLAGWTIEVHEDSANGAFVTSVVTDGSGNYSLQLVPGTYVLTEVPDTLIGRQTYPVSGEHTIVVAAPGNTPSSVYTGVDFGNFIYGRIRINLTVDINGDGIVGGGDVLPLPAIVGTFSTFEFKKNSVTVSVDTLGVGVASILHSGLDVGTYDVVENTFTPGWIRTKTGTFTKVISAGSQSDTARYMDFKMLTITGRKYNDLNGNGADDSEPGLSGWTMNVSGSVLGAASAVTDGSGNYSIDSVGIGLHNITETAQIGWTQTAPASPYSFTAVSGNLTNPVAARDFGNFQNYSISGTKYRDRNSDGDKDGEDDGLSGWTINLNPGAISTTTDANGDYSFTNVGPGAKVVSETAQLGWIQTAPVGGTHNITGASGTNVSGRDFGNFQATDSTAYRTFTLAQLQADNQKKIIKYKAGKPILSGPNTANMLLQLFAQGGVVKVGLSGQLNAGGKEKAYIQPAKYGDVWKSLNAKSVYHTGVARGLDLDVKGKLLLKRYKALNPLKKNDSLIGNLLALQVNLAASGLKTPAGLGALLYNDAGHDLDGFSIDQIADYADTVMTNWEGQPYGVYIMLDSVVAKINQAFAPAGVVLPLDDTTATGGWTGAKLQWKAYTTVIDVPFLKASGNPAKNRFATPTTSELPDEFALAQNFPNPFNPTTTIQFDLAEQSLVTLKIYNMLGQEVATLLDREELVAGTEELEFDASSLSSGVYLYRVVAESVNDDGAVSQTYTQVKKMVLLK